MGHDRKRDMRLSPSIDRQMPEPENPPQYTLPNGTAFDGIQGDLLHIGGKQALLQHDAPVGHGKFRRPQPDLLCNEEDNAENYHAKQDQGEPCAQVRKPMEFAAIAKGFTVIEPLFNISRHGPTLVRPPSKAERSGRSSNQAATTNVAITFLRPVLSKSTVSLLPSEKATFP